MQKSRTELEFKQSHNINRSNNDIYIYMYMCRYKCLYMVRICICISAHTYIHICIYIYICMYIVCMNSAQASPGISMFRCLAWMLAVPAGHTEQVWFSSRYSPQAKERRGGPYSLVRFHNYWILMGLQARAYEKKGFGLGRLGAVICGIWEVSKNRRTPK